MPDVSFESATRHFDRAPTPAVAELSLEVASGEFLVLVGPSGSGKSTALRMLGGLEPVDSGAVRVGGRDVTNLPPKARDVAMVFQNYALFPHLDVAGNIGFGLKLRRVPRAERDRRVHEAAAMLGLDDLLSRKPAELSGGQRQRVTMGRAIVRKPQVFLMDEPLSNLDAQLRTQTRAEISSLQRDLGVTTIYVTHDQVEAMTMGDRIAVMRDGRLQQAGKPRSLFDEPANTFVASFIGSPPMNLRTVPVKERAVLLGQTQLALPELSAGHVGARSTLTLGIRPEHCELSDQGVAMEVSLVEELGSEVFVYGVLADDRADDRSFAVRDHTHTPPRKGEIVHLSICGPVHLFDATTGERLAPGKR